MSMFAQDVTLTKQETVNYLNKKMREIQSMQACNEPTITPNKFEFASASVGFDYESNQLKFIYSGTRTQKNNVTISVEFSQIFNPLHIKEIKEISSTDQCAVHWIRIELKGYLGKRNGSDWNNFAIPFLKVDSFAFEKIKKAFLHLQALLKAEDDPFGN